MNSDVLHQAEHPTKASLVECTRRLVSRLGVDAVTVEMVLTESGVSKGSLYHHFKDFDALIETVQVRSFSEFVDEGINFLEAALGSATSRDELRANLYAVIPLAHDPARAPHRIDRARIVGSSGHSLAFSQGLAREQERLRRCGEQLIAEAQAKGWINRSLSPRALSSFVLGFTFGRVLDDVCQEHVRAEDWNDVVHQFMDRVLLAVED